MTDNFKLRCVICAEPISSDYRIIHEGRAKRRSQGKTTSPDHCVDCAIAATGRYGRRPHHIDPILCTCYGTIRRDPVIRSMCAACLRLLRPCCEAEPGDEFTTGHPNPNNRRNP